MMPLKVAATFVKLAMPPPMMRILPLGLGVPRVMRSTGVGGGSIHQGGEG